MTCESRGNAEHLVLKGFAQRLGYVVHPCFRRQSDIDPFPDSIVSAQDALSRLGYEPVEWVGPGPTDHLPAMIRKTGWKWRGDFFDKHRVWLSLFSAAQHLLMAAHAFVLSLLYFLTSSRLVLVHDA